VLREFFISLLIKRFIERLRKNSYNHLIGPQHWMPRHLACERIKLEGI
jgi:hypothetical protein